MQHAWFYFGTVRPSMHIACQDPGQAVRDLGNAMDVGVDLVCADQGHIPQNIQAVDAGDIG